MATSEPTIKRSSFPFCRVEGIFYRAVDPLYRSDVLAGSRLAGRYSSAAQPTLYLSASVEGARAAIAVHAGQRAERLEQLGLHVRASHILDLRDPVALRDAGIEQADALAPWQSIVAAGGTPSSWKVSDHARKLGAFGLIDPSRQAPGLWHLVLFAWNRPGAPDVAIVR